MVYITDKIDVAHFNISSQVTVEIECDEHINQLDIRPLKHGIKPHINGKKAMFTIDKAVKLSIEVNKNPEEALFLFADEPEHDKPDPKEPNVYYLKSGMVYDMGQWTIDKDNVTVYIEKGAVLQARLWIKKADNVKILGQGIIDGRKYDGSVRIINSSNVVYSGPLVFNDGNWTNGIYISNGVEISNIKSVSTGRYSDAIDLLAANNVKIDDVFLKSDDDCITLKLNKFDYAGNTENILVQNSVIYNGIPGKALTVGAELESDYLKNVTFKNIDIIHVFTDNNNKLNRAAICIYHDGKSVVENITFENITVENTDGHLFYFDVIKGKNTYGSGGGPTRNIYVKNINYIGESRPTSVIRGNDEVQIESLVFENIFYQGKKIDGIDAAIDANMSIEYADVTWK